MTDNQLTRVPADICQLTHLIKLDLSYNKLRSLPVEIGDLISLRYVVSHHSDINTKYSIHWFCFNDDDDDGDEDGDEDKNKDGDDVSLLIS